MRIPLPYFARDAYVNLEISALVNDKHPQQKFNVYINEKFLNQLYDNSVNPFTPGDYLSKLSNPNGLLIIDEAHRLVSATGTSYRKLLFGLTFHAHPQFKTVLLTGSPIYDKPFEFGLLMNLLRPRIVFPDGYDNFNEIFIDPETKNITNIELFKKMTSSYVSYFKGGNPEAYPYKKTIVMHHTMDPYQYSIYKEALIKEIEKDKENGIGDREDFLIKFISSESNNDEVSTSVFNNSRLFCNIAFPEIILGPEQLKSKKGIRKAKAEAGLTRLKQILISEARQSTPDKVQENVLNKLKEFSTKFAKVAEIIQQSEGPVFVYSNYVTYGVDAMAIVMFALGYNSFPYGEPGKSFFIWKGSVDSYDIDKARSVFNSKENIDGSKLKIIFGTQSVMEGVDFKAVRQIHVLDPWWNDSRLQQVIARGIRLCSHKELPASKRITDVFIHLSTIGSGERLYKVKYKKMIPGRITPAGGIGESSIEIKNTQSTLIPANISEPSSNWFYYEAATFLDKTNNVKDIKEFIDENHKFYANQIVSYSKIIDPQLTRKFGGWKNLDSISVEEYMYSRALAKLNVNRQFEQVIKETSIDCSLNKYGNIIRLDERYQPIGENKYKLYYENYSSGKIYYRLGIKSKYDKSLADGILTLEDILENTSKNSDKFDFVDENGVPFKVNKNLIISENINCKAGDINYSFENIPPKIVNLTINKELLKYIMKIPINKLKLFLRNIEKGSIEVSDPKLITKIRKLYSKEAMSEKQQLIEKLTNIGIGDEDTPWDLESLESLKKLYKNITKKNYTI